MPISLLHLAQPGHNGTDPSDLSYGSAVLDSAPIGDVTGAFGTLGQDDSAPRKSWPHRLKTLLCIIGPASSS